MLTPGIDFRDHVECQIKWNICKQSYYIQIPFHI